MLTVVPIQGYFAFPFKGPFPNSRVLYVLNPRHRRTRCACSTPPAVPFKGPSFTAHPTEAHSAVFQRPHSRVLLFPPSRLDLVATPHARAPSPDSRVLLPPTSRNGPHRPSTPVGDALHSRVTSKSTLRRRVTSKLTPHETRPTGRPTAVAGPPGLSHAAHDLRTRPGLSPKPSTPRVPAARWPPSS